MKPDSTSQERENETGKKNSFSRSLRVIWLKLKRLAGLYPDTDVESTITSIKKSVEFKGANLWILAFAIIIASIGLDVNSTAVIIGAMLISPLMGPINGIGLAIGISDSELLRKSLKNFLIMVGISLLASTFYFLVSPLSDAQSELLARTKPTIFDVMIAFVGGMAGIVALSRKEQPFMVISGVAIATALMPPLCTAGFGIATGQWNYFLGAFYLFFINSFFIALATFLMVRFLKFPHKKYLDPDKSKRVSRYISIFTIIVIIPSIFIAISVIRETAFNNAAIRYISEVQESPVFDKVELINSRKTYGRKERTITLSIVGQTLDGEDVEWLNQKLLDYGLTKTKLHIKQTGLSGGIELESVLIENILDKKEQQLVQKDSIIRELENNILLLNNTSAEYARVAHEIAVQYPAVSHVSITNMTFTETSTLKATTVPTVYIQWKKKPDAGQKEQLVKWLKVRLGVEELRIID